MDCTGHCRLGRYGLVAETCFEDDCLLFVILWAYTIGVGLETCWKVGILVFGMIVLFGCRVGVLGD